MVSHSDGMTPVTTHLPSQATTASRRLLCIERQFEHGPSDTQSTSHLRGQLSAGRGDAGMVIFDSNFATSASLRTPTPREGGGVCARLRERL